MSNVQKPRLIRFLPLALLMLSLATLAQAQKISRFSVRDSIGTIPWGINDSNTVAGHYLDTADPPMLHGFIRARIWKDHLV
jgi:hypothetical protein